MPLDLIFDVANPQRNLLITDVFSTSTYSIGGQVRNDKNLAITIQPVTVNPSGSFALYAPDYEPTDSFEFAIGLANEAPTSGTFKLTVGATTTGLTVLAYNVSAAALQTPLSAAFVTEGESACTVTLLATGLYRIRANSNGAITPGFVVGDGSNLLPDSSAFITEEDLGSAGTPYVLLLTIRQQPMVYAAPATALPTAGVTVTTTAAGSSTSNRIQKISLDAPNTYDGTYKITASAGAAQDITGISVANPTVVTVADHGFPNAASVVFAGSNSTPTIDGTRTITVIDADTFSVAVNVTVAGTQGTAQYTQDTTCGVAQPTISADQLALILSGHPQIFFNEANGTPDNIAVTKSGQDYFVEFTGSLGNSTAPTLTCTDINLVAPQGVSGNVDLNTIPLNYYSTTQTSDTFTLTCSVTRTRASGEVATIFGPTDILISDDILDPTTMVPAGLPTYLTEAQGNTLYARLAAANIFTMTNEFQDTVDFTGTGDVNVSSTGTLTVMGPTDVAMTADNSLTLATNSGDLIVSAGGLVALGTNTYAQSGWAVVRTATATDYTVLLTDYLIGVTSTASARIVTLPNATTTFGASQIFIVKDESGAANVNNITVKSAGGTIDGVAAGTGVAINTAYGFKSFYSNGTNYFSF